MFLQLQQHSLLMGRQPAGFTEHYYTEWDDGLDSERISLFLVLSIDSTQVPGAELGKEAFQLLQDHFLADLTGEPYERFEAALREINLMVTEKQKELQLKFIPNMHMVMGVIQKDMLYLSQRGDAVGYLVRKRHVSSITEGLYDSKNTEDLFQNIASGQLEVTDSLLFVTGQLVQYVTPKDLSKLFSEQSVHSAGRELKGMLDKDLERQMALLALEVLEKTHQVAKPAPVETEKEPEPSSKKAGATRLMDLKKAQLKAGIATLHKWAIRKEQWAMISRLRHMERKQLLLMIAALGGVIVVGIFLLYLSSGKKRELEGMEEKLSVAESNVVQAQTRGAFDKGEAADLLNEAESLTIEVLDSGLLGGEASQLLDEIEEQRNYLDNVVMIEDELELVVDLSDSIDSELVGVESYGESVVVYTENEAFEVLLDELQDPDELTSDQRVLAANYFADRDNVVMITDAGQVIEYTDGNAQFADTSDVTWNSAVDITTYSNRIYLLDPESSQIWKYTRGTSSYGGAQANVDSEEVDLSAGISMAIDGNIWVLEEGGNILQLLSGDLVDFSVKREPLVSIETATMIYTELELSQLYVLDPANDRLLVYEKSANTGDLTYAQQYVFSDLKGDLVDVYVDKDRDVFVLVTDRALYELGF